MKNRSNMFYIFLSGIAIFFYTGLTDKCCAQDPDEPPISYSKKIEVVMTNPLDAIRKNETIVIPLSSILEKAPDFNKQFYRLKHKTSLFEPLDIPSQIRVIPGMNERVEELLFQVDLAPREKIIVGLWYNPEGYRLPDYPPKTQSFHIGDSVSWENKIIAHRTYNGIIDYFAKSYPHFLLHDLVYGSYHHERVWGIDPFVIGRKPGLCGVILFVDGERITCYGNPENGSNHYVPKVYKGGPVSTVAVFQVVKDGKVLVEESYSLHAGRYENVVQTVLSKEYVGKDVLVAPGMQKFEGDFAKLDEKKGYWALQVIPIEEYGTISYALIWNPDDARGTFETDDGRFIKLKPDTDGVVNYLSLAVWNRGSAEQPSSPQPFIEMVEKITREFNNPVSVELTR